jgi:RNA-binding protein NOB1
VYSIPSPKGGRKAEDLVLREDQKEFIQKQKSYQVQRKKQESKEWDELMFNSSPVRRPTIGFGGKNPNEARRARK